ncbi:hypothetical protein D7Z54_33785 [Salibacterium salarium]|uniref:Uncharacterized protein n=1 Tax=Salibacterium salarium TaxID=284579 RepID=A0A3R9R7M3_9BACI|nr:hypothetical protein [Salibacterium salarium]RSL28950.1 hypothetical protein D7Z54_33785 [Salibacterium salarium]
MPVNNRTGRKPGADYPDKPIAEWNVNHWHRYLIDKNAELFDAEYIPFGKGPISQRWRTEKGQLKQAQAALGNTVLLAFIDRCLATHTPKPDFPHVNFGFMWAYRRDEVSRANAEVSTQQRRQEAEAEIQAEMDEGDIEW